MKVNFQEYESKKVYESKVFECSKITFMIVRSIVYSSEKSKAAEAACSFFLSYKLVRLYKFAF